MRRKTEPRHQKKGRRIQKGEKHLKETVKTANIFTKRYLSSILFFRLNFSLSCFLDIFSEYIKRFKFGIINHGFINCE